MCYQSRILHWLPVKARTEYKIATLCCLSSSTHMFHPDHSLHMMHPCFLSLAFLQLTMASNHSLIQTKPLEFTHTISQTCKTLNSLKINMKAYLSRNTLTNLYCKWGQVGWSRALILHPVVKLYKCVCTCFHMFVRFVLKIDCTCLYMCIYCMYSEIT